MFDLEQAIAEWRRQMLSAGLEALAVDELEGHLRETFDSELETTPDPAATFTTAAQLIGPPSQLAREYKKVPGSQWPQAMAWIAWMLFIVSFFLTATTNPSMPGYQCARTILPWNIVFSGTLPEFFQCLPLIFHYTLLDVGNLFLCLAPFLLWYLSRNEQSLRQFSRWTLAVTIVIVAFIPASAWLYQFDFRDWRIGFYAWQFSFVLFYVSVRVRLRHTISPDDPQLA